MHEPQTMIANLMATMDQINEQIQEVNQFAAQQEIPVATVRYPDGRWVMAELSLAKAQVLHAMVLMEEQINREVVRKRNEDESCVHCGVAIQSDGHGDWVHKSGLYRCQSKNVEYGHLAHPSDVSCRATGPNPCLGSR